MEGEVAVRQSHQRHLEEAVLPLEALFHNGGTQFLHCHGHEVGLPGVGPPAPAEGLRVLQDGGDVVRPGADDPVVDAPLLQLPLRLLPKPFGGQEHQQGPRRAEVEIEDQEDIQGDVAEIAHGKADAGQLLLVVVSQEVVQQVGGEKQRDAGQDDLHVLPAGSPQHRIGGVRSQQGDQRGEQDRPRRRQRGAQRHRRQEDALKTPVGLLPAAPGQLGGITDGAAQTKTVHDDVDHHKNRQAQADGRQPHNAHALAHHHGVRHVSHGKAQGGYQSGRELPAEHPACKVIPIRAVHLCPPLVHLHAPDGAHDPLHPPQPFQT